MNGSTTAAPAELVVSGVHYLRDDGLCAVMLAAGEPRPDDSHLHLPGEGIVVLPAGSPAGRGRTAGPVYRAQPGGQPVVPTGRVFVRLTETASLTERAGDMMRHGFAIESLAPHAPHAGWLQPLRKEGATALGRLAQLRALPGVASVEPQLLRPVSLR